MVKGSKKVPSNYDKALAAAATYTVRLDPIVGKYLLPPNVVELTDASILSRREKYAEVDNKSEAVDIDKLLEFHESIGTNLIDCELEEFCKVFREGNISFDFRYLHLIKPIIRWSKRIDSYFFIDWKKCLVYTKAVDAKMSKIAFHDALSDESNIIVKALEKHVSNRLQHNLLMAGLTKKVDAKMCMYALQTKYKLSEGNVTNTQININTEKNTPPEYLDVRSFGSMSNESLRNSLVTLTTRLLDIPDAEEVSDADK